MTMLTYAVDITMRNFVNKIILIGLSASLTSKCSVTLFGTSGVGDYGLVVMSQLIFENGIAHSTDLIGRTGCGGTGFVAGCCGFVALVRIVTTGAGVGRVTLFGTSGLCNNRLIVMT